MKEVTGRYRSLSFSEMSAAFSYNHETGEIVRLDKSSTRAIFLGTVGYRIAIYKSIFIPCPHLAWMLHYGYWLPGPIDHIDLDKTNDAASNIRPTTARLNNANHPKRPDCASSFKGVTLHKQTGKWQAQIKRGDGKNKYLGLYSSEEEARDAYCQAAEAAFGSFARTG